MKKNLILIVVATLLAIPVLFTSCKEAKKEAATEESCCAKVSPDSLIALWNNAWNTKNMDALKAMIGDSALVIDRDWYVKGKDSIFAKWISTSLPVVNKVQTSPLKISQCCCCVVVTGLYTLEFTTKDGKTVPSKGNFTFHWQQADDKSWKLELMHMTEFVEGK